MSTPSNYTRTAVALHWLVGALVILALAMGWIMTDLPTSALKGQVYSWHKWVGVTVLGLFFVRGLWRLTHAVPPPLAVAAWQRLVAHILHVALYTMLLLQPLSVGKDKPLAEALKGVHDTGAVIVAVAVGLHVLAALKHHFIDRDDTLRRMLRWRTN
jgi:cytochrome b561